MQPSPYYNASRIDASVVAGKHRHIIGGLWDEIGQLQFDFLKWHGLTPDKTLLDIGCGSLRGGIHFVRYLNPANYYGVDINQSLLDAGYEIELAKAGLKDRLPRKNLVCNADFDFSSFQCTFNIAIAQSVFTHLPLNHIRQCLERLWPVMVPGGTFFATFFEAPENQPLYQDLTHHPGDRVTHALQDPYHYRISDLDYACGGLPWKMTYIGEWNHPRGQRIVAFIRSESRGDITVSDKAGVSPALLLEEAQIRIGDTRDHVGSVLIDDSEIKASSDSSHYLSLKRLLKDYLLGRTLPDAI